MDKQIAFKYNKITIAERCINKNIRYVVEYQLKFKQLIKEIQWLTFPDVVLIVC